MKTQWLACLAVVLAACPSVDVDPPDEANIGPTVEFDPANKIIPFPNNLLLDPTTGKVKLPEQCNESATAAALRDGVLNNLNGFGTYETAMTVTFTEPIDAASLAGHVLVYQRTAAGVANDPLTAQPIPDAGLVLIPGKTIRFNDQTTITACTDPVMVDQLAIVSRAPLQQKSVYTVALTAGIKTAAGADLQPSSTWAIVRNPEPVVAFDDAGNVTLNRTPLDPREAEGIAQLQGIDLLWKAHHDAITFLAGAGHQSDELLLAFEFKTQTTTDPLDSAVAGSPAATALTTIPLQGVARINGAANGENFLRAALPGSCSADGGPLPCQAVGEALAGGLLAGQYQVELTNPFDANKPIPGPWGDPYAPASVKNEIVGAVITTVAGTACDAAGCPTVIFGHGLGSTKTTMFAIASQLAASGFNTVAIDFVAHGSRAIRISNDAAIGCDGTPDPTVDHQCFAPFLSADLGGTRDNIRQSIVDLHSLVAALKGCGTANCGALKVDPTKVLYAGISLGGIMGSTATATTDVKAAVLNVPAVGWVDVLENSDTLEIKCPLVDALIDAGILTGDKLDPVAGTGLCTGDEWLAQPGYQQFAAIGRWVLDPADGANFTPSLATQRILIQRVENDAVVPNVATNNEGALVGLALADSDCGNPSAPPSMELVSGMQTNHFLNYATVAPGTTGCLAGNTYQHASLLAPTGRCATTTTTICDPRGAVGSNGCPNNEVCNSSNDGSLATLRLQTDAFAFLTFNK